MAIVDPRIFPLIETLVHVGADWLAFEVLEGIQAGEVPAEPHERLRLAQESVRAKKRPIKERPQEDLLALPTAVPRLGDSQLFWAAAYVSRRLRDSVEMLERSFDRLETVLSSSRDRQPVHVGQDAITVVLQAGDEQLSSSRRAVHEARFGIELLSQSLNEWLDSLGIKERAE